MEPINKNNLILYEWSIKDSEDQIEIRFEIPESLNSNIIEIELYENNEYINVFYSNYPPILCGKLFKKIQSFNKRFENKYLILSLQKEIFEFWPILITTNNKINGLIDPKSAFLIYKLFLNSKEHQEIQTSNKYLEFSASIGFLPAMRQLSSILLQKQETWEIALQILYKCAEEFKDPSSAFHLSLIFSQNPKLIDKSFELMHIAAESEFPDAFIGLGEFYSPHSEILNSNKDPIKALDYLKKGLNKKESWIGYHELAKLYLFGSAVPKDYEKALFYQNKAINLNPETPNLPIIQENNLNQEPKINNNNENKMNRPLLIGLTIGIGTIFGFILFKKLKKK